MMAMLLSLLLSPQDDLVRELADDNPEIRERAEGNLIRLGERAREALLRATTSTDPEVKARATALLKRLDVYSEFRPWYAPESRVTLSGEMTLESAVREVEKQTGQKVGADAWPEGTFRVELKDVAYWEALETLCGASGKRTLLNREGVSHLGGDRHVKVSSVISGPFRIAAGGITESRRFNVNSARDDRSFSLDLGVQWETPIALVRAYNELSKVEDDTGVDHVEGFYAYEKSITSGYFPGFLENKHGSLDGFNLTTNAAPTSEARRLTRLSGTITLYIQGAKEEIDLPIPAFGTVARAELPICNDRLEEPVKLRIALSEPARQTTTFTCTLAFENVDHRLVEDIFNYLYLRDRAGNRYQGTPGNTSLPERGRVFDLNFEGVPAAAELLGITVRLPKKLVRKDIPFVLRDIPLR